MVKRAFTLVELLVVMAIMAILMGILTPVVARAHKYAQQQSAAMSLRQLGPALTMYLSDADDMFPPGTTDDGGRMTSWFGAEMEDGTINTEMGSMSPYRGGKLGIDPLHHARPFKGDMTGFGYNRGYLGSNVYEKVSHADRQFNYIPAVLSNLAAPSDTISFATSSYYNPTWIEGGDGVTYDYGFIDPPVEWVGQVPTVDFRHGDVKIVNHAAQTVEGNGYALFLFVDGRVKPLKRSQVTEELFDRK